MIGTITLEDDRGISRPVFQGRIEMGRCAWANRNGLQAKGILKIQIPSPIKIRASRLLESIRT